VITFARHAFDGALDLRRDLAGMRVHEVPYLPLASASRASQGSIARWEAFKTATRRLRFSMGVFGDPRLLAYRPMLRMGAQICAERRFDVIVATSPPEVAFVVARALARRFRIPWVADFRDLWFRDMLLYRSRLAEQLSGPLNRWLVKTASVLVTVSEGLQHRLSRYLGREVVLSYNGFFSEPPGPLPTAAADGKKRIVYTGRLYPGKRDPEPLLRALASLRASAPEAYRAIAVDFYGFDDPWLRGLIARHGVEDCVRLRGFVPYRESIALQKAADMLLFLDWTEPSAEGVLTGKLFEYLGSGRPILSVGRRRDSEAARLIAGAGAGCTLTEDHEIAEYLRRLASSPRPPDIAPAALQRFSRERQAAELLDAIVARVPGSRQA
jgi:glycosyltransferase involved in cell wall biosynthesis